jgi:hypothetical protein
VPTPEITVIAFARGVLFGLLHQSEHRRRKFIRKNLTRGVVRRWWSFYGSQSPSRMALLADAVAYGMAAPSSPRSVAPNRTCTGSEVDGKLRGRAVGAALLEEVDQRISHHRTA